LRLKCRVNVLPQPGTGQTKFASFFLRMALASAVAVVVTFCLLTMMEAAFKSEPVWSPLGPPPIPPRDAIPPGGTPKAVAAYAGSDTGLPRPIPDTGTDAIDGNGS